MPGIVGIISQRPPDECARLVASMVRSMEHESSYTSGTYAVPELGIYGGWVAHRQSLAAGQVFFNEGKDVALLFSGECFIDPDTRAELTRKGHQIPDTDAGWLVHLYEETGDDVFESINGLFSGVLIDRRRRLIFLFNDRYGMERIYWHETEDAMYFASEAKALLRVVPAIRAFDDEGVADFVTFGCTLNWRTLFRDVAVLPGGSVWSFGRGTCRRRRYFVPSNWESQPLTSEAFESAFQETFSRILPRYFDSSVRVGLSLTGGLDTRMIMACRPTSVDAPVCYTFAGVRGETVDARLAARVAQVSGLHHELLRISPEFFADFARFADETVYITDGCFGVTGAHEIQLHRQARRLAPVRLTGNFGSEVLRSMSTFKPLDLAPDLLNPKLRGPMCAAAETAVSTEHPVSFAAFKEVPWSLFGSLSAGRSQVTFRTPYLDNDIVALAFRAPQSVRASPAASWRVVEKNNPALSDIPTDRGYAGEPVGVRSALRRLVSEGAFKLDYFCNEGLPDAMSGMGRVFEVVGSRAGFFGRHKYLHYRSWFRKELAPYVTEASTRAAARSGVWNREFVVRMGREHVVGRRNYVREINAVLTLDAVDRLLIRGSASAMPDTVVPSGSQVGRVN